MLCGIFIKIFIKFQVKRPPRKKVLKMVVMLQPFFKHLSVFCSCF